MTIILLTLNKDIRVGSVELGTTDGFARDVGPVEILRGTVHINADSSLTYTQVSVPSSCSHDVSRLTAFVHGRHRFRSLTLLLQHRTTCSESKNSKITSFLSYRSTY